MKSIRITSIVLLLLTGLNAIVAGILFMIDPSGQKMGMSVEYLNAAPFASFLVPGIILFVVNGVLNVLAAYFTMLKKRHYPYWVTVQGILLGGWIIVQVLMVQDINALHIVMFCIGGVLTLSGLVLGRFENAQ